VQLFVFVRVDGKQDGCYTQKGIIHMHNRICTWIMQGAFSQICQAWVQVSPETTPHHMKIILTIVRRGRFPQYYRTAQNTVGFFSWSDL